MKNTFTLMIFALAAAFGTRAAAQTNNIQPNLVQVTITVSSSGAAKLAELASNGVAIDTVINLGMRATLGQAQARLRQQIQTMTFQQISNAYPTLVPLVDTNLPPIMRLNQMQQLAILTLSRARTAGSAVAIAHRHQEAIRLCPRLDMDTNSAAGRFLQRTN